MSRLLRSDTGKLLLPRLLGDLAQSTPARLKAVLGMRSVYERLENLVWRGIRQTVWEIEGSRMHLDPWERSPMRRTFRSYLRAPKEPLTTKLFKETIRRGDTVLDVGANIGFFSLLAARLVGETGRVYAFEPEPRNFRFLIKNIALNAYGQIVAYNKAVWRRPGHSKLYLSNELDTGAHTLRVRHAMRYFDQTSEGQFVEVECVVMDSFLAPPGRIDVIKMDIEGAEAGALEGMVGIIRDNPGLKLFVEFYPDAIREMGDSPEVLIRTLLGDYGFSGLVIDELGATTRMYPINHIDALLALCRERAKIVNLLLTRETRRG